MLLCESSFCISFGNQGPGKWRKSWRGAESRQLEVQSEASIVGFGLGFRDTCCYWPTVFQQVRSRRSHSAGNLGDFCASEGEPSHRAKTTSDWSAALTKLNWAACSYGILSRGRWETAGLTGKMSWRPLDWVQMDTWTKGTRGDKGGIHSNAPYCRLN